MDSITIIVPCYNEEETIPIFIEEMDKVYNSMKEKYDISMEYLFVDDGSRDRTLSILKEYAEKNERISYITFSRNFGKEAAMYAGIENSRGDYTVIIDADLQDPPELVEEMYCILKSEEKYDCVASRRFTRTGEPKIRSWFAKMFYKIMGKISKTEIVDGARDFRMMSRQMVDAILSLTECNRFSKGIFSWVGFETKWLEFENRERAGGTTKWSFWGLLVYAIEGVVAFSTAPLAISSIIGIIFCLLAFLGVCFVFVRALLFGDKVAGWPSLACIMCFIAGIQLFCNGISGIYLSKTYTETKHRPQYIAKKIYRCTSFKDDSEK
ncbi:MAG: glycosyltransferase family 2 protein [Oscillospiraceae bacterium]|nr:glycosyltransferase family 2 protein [Oscillospiraceae bacterium]